MRSPAKAGWGLGKRWSARAPRLKQGAKDGAPPEGGAQGLLEGPSRHPFVHRARPLARTRGTTEMQPHPALGFGGCGRLIVAYGAARFRCCASGLFSDTAGFSRHSF